MRQKAHPAVNSDTTVMLGVSNVLTNRSGRNRKCFTERNLPYFFILKYLPIFIFEQMTKRQSRSSHSLGGRRTKVTSFHGEGQRSGALLLNRLVQHYSGLKSEHPHFSVIMEKFTRKLLF